MANVFISHSWDNEQLADQVRGALERHGYEVWTDQKIEPGAMWSGSIGTALKEADSFVFLLGDRTSGAWTSLELGQALASGKRVVPVLTDKDAEVPALLRGYQFVDLSDPAVREKEIGRLSSVLGSEEWRPSDPEGIELVREASMILERARQAQAAAVSARLRKMVRAQTAVALVAVVAATVALIVAAGSASEILTSIVSGLIATAACTIGLYVGRRDG